MTELIFSFYFIINSSLLEKTKEVKGMLLIFPLKPVVVGQYIQILVLLDITRT